MEKQASYKALKHAQMLKLFNQEQNNELANTLYAIYEKISDYDDEAISTGSNNPLLIFSNFKQVLKCNKRYEIFNKIFNHYVTYENDKILSLKNPSEYIKNHLEILKIANCEEDGSTKRKLIIKFDDRFLKEINKAISQEQ